MERFHISGVPVVDEAATSWASLQIATYGLKHDLIFQCPM
jgi:hypothetical protein